MQWNELELQADGLTQRASVLRKAAARYVDALAVVAQEQGYLAEALDEFCSAADEESVHIGCPLLKHYVHLFADLKDEHVKLGDQVCPISALLPSPPLPRPPPGVTCTSARIDFQQPAARKSTADAASALPLCCAVVACYTPVCFAQGVPCTAVGRACAHACTRQFSETILAFSRWPQTPALVTAVVCGHLFGPAGSTLKAHSCSMCCVLVKRTREQTATSQTGRLQISPQHEVHQPLVSLTDTQGAAWQVGATYHVILHLALAALAGSAHGHRSLRRTWDVCR